MGGQVIEEQSRTWSVTTDENDRFDNQSSWHLIIWKYSRARTGNNCIIYCIQKTLLIFSVVFSPTPFLYMELMHPRLSHCPWATRVHRVAAGASAESARIFTGSTAANDTWFPTWSSSSVRSAARKSTTAKQCWKSKPVHPLITKL